MITSRFDSRLSYYIIIFIVISFVTSLFLLQLFVGILTILWLLEKNENKKNSLDIFAYFIIGFGLIRIIAVIFSKYQSSSIEIFYKEILFYFGFLSLQFYFKTFDLKRINNIVYVFIGIASFVALIGVIKFNLNLVYRAEAFTTYTTFASYLLVAFAFAVSLSKEIEKKFKPVTSVIILTLILTGIITSLGRTITVIAILIFIYSVIFKKIKYKLLISVVGSIVILSFISFHNNKSELSARIENPTYLSDRGILFKGAKNLVLKTPIFGFGPRTFHQIFPYSNQFKDKGLGGWHSDFYQVYFETGIFGLISYIALIVLLFTKSYKLINNYKEFRNIGYGILLALVGLVLSAFTIGFITHVVLSIVFVFIIALLSALLNEEIIKVNLING